MNLPNLIVIVYHNKDMDGFFSEHFLFKILKSYQFKNNFIITSIGYDYSESTDKLIINESKYYNFINYIFIDIVPDWDFLFSLYNEQIKNIIIIDHHISKYNEFRKIENKKFDSKLAYFFSNDFCATQILYNLITNKLDNIKSISVKNNIITNVNFKTYLTSFTNSNVRTNPFILDFKLSHFTEELINIVDIYDTYKWYDAKTGKKDLEALILNEIFYFNFNKTDETLTRKNVNQIIINLRNYYYLLKSIYSDITLKQIFLNYYKDNDLLKNIYQTVQNNFSNKYKFIYSELNDGTKVILTNLNCIDFYVQDSIRNELLNDDTKTEYDVLINIKLSLENNCFKFSVRSLFEKNDVSKISQTYFNGGGHKFAGGGHLPLNINLSDIFIF